MQMCACEELPRLLQPPCSVGLLTAHGVLQYGMLDGTIAAVLLTTSWRHATPRSADSFAQSLVRSAPDTPGHHLAQQLNPSARS